MFVLQLFYFYILFCIMIYFTVKTKLKNQKKKNGMAPHTSSGMAGGREMPRAK